MPNHVRFFMVLLVCGTIYDFFIFFGEFVGVAHKINRCEMFLRAGQNGRLGEQNGEKEENARK